MMKKVSSTYEACPNSDVVTINIVPIFLFLKVTLEGQSLLIWKEII